MSLAKSNPLSTRFVQPGRISWRARQPEQSLERLANYFTCKLNWRAAIVGPHGSGKSTLLEHLVPTLGSVVWKRATYDQGDSAPEIDPIATSEPASRRIVWLTLRGAKASAQMLRDTRHLWRGPDRLLVIDGYEQLSWFSRALCLLQTSRARSGLLVTTHRRSWLPTLIETAVDARLAQQLLEDLLPIDLPDRAATTDPARLARLLQSHEGNMRELFMQLYDEIELGVQKR